MFLLKILSEQSNTLRTLIDNNKIYTYYSLEEQSNGISTPVLKYISKDDSGNPSIGVIGREQLKNNVVEKNTTGKVDNRYIFIHSTGNKTFTLPTAENKLHNQMIEVLYALDEGEGTVTIAGGALWNGVELESVKLDCFNNRCLLIYNKTISKWYFYEPFLNNYSYYHEVNLNGDVTAQNNRRYLVTANNKTITLPNITSIINDNFRIAVSLETLASSTVTIRTPVVGNVILYRQQTGLTNIVFSSNTTKSFELVYNKTKNAFVIINEIASIDWDVQYISSTKTAESGHKYVCQNITENITINLPSSPSAGDKIAVFTEKLSTGSVIISGNGKNIQFGTSLIQASATDNTITLPAPLIYIEFSFDGTLWHVVEISVPSSSKAPQPDYITITEDGTTGIWSVNNLSSRLGAGNHIKLSANTEGITYISSLLGDGTHTQIGSLTNGKYPINSLLSGDVNETIKIEDEQIKAYNLSSRLSGTRGVQINPVIVANGITTIGINTANAAVGDVLTYNGSDVIWNAGGGSTLPTLPTTGTYVLACINGTLTWIEAKECE